jgi:NDP-sugar pyrophosphorylase family protein
MKAMIFAAGLGTRLKPITDERPKALVPVSGKPLLQHIIEKLVASGFTEVIINVHHFAGQIIQFLQDNNNFNIDIRISDESGMLLDTGGGIRKVSHFFNDGKPFLVHNVDILSNADLTELYNYHVQKGGISTLLVSHRQTSRYLLFNEENTLEGWVNDLTGEIKTPFPDLSIQHMRKMAFSGVHVLSPDIFNWMNNFPEKFSIIDFYLDIAAKTTIKGYPVEDLKIIDVGKIDSLKEAENFVHHRQEK